jgi:hypothetical protein
MNRGHAALARRGQERVCALTPKPVGLREAAVEIPREAHVGQSGRLVDDRVGLVFEHGLSHGAGIEQIELDRLRAERPQAFVVSWGPEGADHLVSSIDQLGNEPAADGTARPRNENSHHVLLTALSHRRDLTGLRL